jgi:signal transduction histidine kinase
VKGFAIIDPDEMTRNPELPPVLIEQVIADGKPQPVGPETAKAGNPAGGKAASLNIRPGVQRLEFDYTALSLTAPGKVFFRYRLEGFETEWQEAETRRTASYTHLSPGNYRFQVVACNDSGVWNEAGAALPLVVLPYFWQTKWFLAFSALGVLGVLGGTVRYLVKKSLQARLERVERESALERERSRIAKDIHDDLGASLTEIAILSELAQHSDAPREEIDSDIGKITTKARSLTRSLDEIVWAVNPQHETLDSFVSYACSYAGDYLRAARISCRLDVPERLPNAPLTANLRHNLFLVLKEALNNIVKHSAASEVWIRMSVAGSELAIIVQDNGRGFLPESVRNGASNATADGMERYGLENMRKRSQSIGGQFQLNSRPDAGTQIRVVIPLTGY